MEMNSPCPAARFVGSGDGNPAKCQRTCLFLEHVDAQRFVTQPKFHYLTYRTKRKTVLQWVYQEITLSEGFYVVSQ
jgi:hypothetical protein